MTIWVGLGANIRGCWGLPGDTLRQAVMELERAGLTLVARSQLYTTRPLGSRRQPPYVNAVAGFTGSIAPAALLRLAKQLERAAGRRTNGRWSSRPLDIDILDFGGRILGRQQRRPGSRSRAAGRLVLPHPEMARRGFVLAPLAAVAPGWRHPVLGVGATELLHGLVPRGHGARGYRQQAAGSQFDPLGLSPPQSWPEPRVRCRNET